MWHWRRQRRHRYGRDAAPRRTHSPLAATTLSGGVSAISSAIDIVLVPASDIAAERMSRCVDNGWFYSVTSPTVPRYLITLPYQQLAIRRSSRARSLRIAPIKSPRAVEARKGGRVRRSIDARTMWLLLGRSRAVGRLDGCSTRE